MANAEILPFCSYSLEMLVKGRFLFHLLSIDHSDELDIFRRQLGSHQRETLLWASRPRIKDAPEVISGPYI